MMQQSISMDIPNQQREAEKTMNMLHEDKTTPSKKMEIVVYKSTVSSVWSCQSRISSR